MAHDNTNSGVLFVNRKRNGNDRAPNMKGNGRVTIDGVEYELDLAAWTRESQKAGKFFSLSIKLKRPPQADDEEGRPRQVYEDDPIFIGR